MKCKDHSGITILPGLARRLLVGPRIWYGSADQRKADYFGQTREETQAFLSSTTLIGWDPGGHEERLQEPVREATAPRKKKRGGNAVEGSDRVFLPVQIPGAENQEDRGRGVTEQNLIRPARCWDRSPWRTSLLTLTTGGDGKGTRALSDTYQT
ncbi:hypothetical protein EYF80_014721 [Liparis tanakae]|uniref:Uncharacterized protein n=1 Tax=Liparis tanakae TaxID=230148 RepID=A0A4Z2IAB7_9TELE|nr:hypothetical protein EYF80_014721 [Liparis tanakae]